MPGTPRAEMMDDEPYRVEHTASLFWQLAQQNPVYPVPLEDIIGWAFPLLLRAVPQLSVRHVHDWLQTNQIAYAVAGTDRRLRGCLFAYRDHGIIFLDSEDPPNEQRFTLAHELAHFLLDYWLPRQRTLHALGESIRAVLDGVRAPTAEERVQAVLARTPLGVHSHLMERPEQGLPSATVLQVENRADRLALEILAPAALLLTRPAIDPRIPYPTRLQCLTMALVSEFGLPATVAGSYARHLLRTHGRPTFQDWLQGMCM